MMNLVWITLYDTRTYDILSLIYRDIQLFLKAYTDMLEAIDFYIWETAEKKRSQPGKEFVVKKIGTFQLYQNVKLDCGEYMQHICSESLKLLRTSNQNLMQINYKIRNQRSVLKYI